MPHTPQANTCPHSSKSGNRLHQIDVLRGLAALLVIVTHASSSFSSHAVKYGHGDLLYRLVQSVDTGRIGVMVFFIVSGFVVANTLHAPNSTLSTFAIRRMFRLYPLFWLSVILVIVFLNGKNELIPTVSDWKTIAINFTMLPSLLGFDPLMILYWTLETEIVFYLVAAAVYKLGYLFDPKKLLILIGGLIGVFAAIMFGLLPSPASLAWKSLGLNLAFMFWGSLFYTIFAKPAVPGTLIRYNHPIVLATALILAPSLFTLLRFFAAGGADDLRWSIAYPSALFIFSSLYFSHGGWMHIASRLGLISYSMYLLHPAAIVVVSLLMENYGFLASGASLPMLAFAAIVVTIAMSLVSYAILEKPAIYLGRVLTSSSMLQPRQGKSAFTLH